MLTLVRPMECKENAGRVTVKSWRGLPVEVETPRLRLVGTNDVCPRSGSAEADEVLTMAVDRLIDHAMAELTRERNNARRRLAGG